MGFEPWSFFCSERTDRPRKKSHHVLMDLSWESLLPILNITSRQNPEQKFHQFDGLDFIWFYRQKWGTGFKSLDIGRGISSASFCTFLYVSIHFSPLSLRKLRREKLCDTRHRKNRKSESLESRLRSLRTWGHLKWGHSIASRLQYD